ncbi:MAG: hypothetical protein FWH10_07160 [Oscillospiraceae bacterium]|nr:hypothetical protein [Oscillospiraceae bacterium]
MGFGLLVIGYISVLGVLPYSFLYYGWGVYTAITGGLAMLAGLCRLEEYNIFFRAAKYIIIVYILILLGFPPFLLFSRTEETMASFMIVSKIIRLCVLFAFHYFLLSGISSLAKEINNEKIEKKTKRNIYMTYIFFSAFILEFLNVPAIFGGLFIISFVYYALIVSNLYSCYMRITYEEENRR